MQKCLVDCYDKRHQGKGEYDRIKKFHAKADMLTGGCTEQQR